MDVKATNVVKDASVNQYQAYSKQGTVEQSIVKAEKALQVKQAKEAEQQRVEQQNNDQEKLDNALDKINKTVRIFNHSIHFTKHEETGRLWVKVIDNDTKKVVREIPPEEVLNIEARLKEMVGLLIDEQG